MYLMLIVVAVRHIRFSQLRESKLYFINDSHNITELLKVYTVTYWHRARMRDATLNRMTFKFQYWHA